MSENNEKKPESPRSKGDIWLMAIGVVAVFIFVAGLEIKNKNDIRSGDYSEDYVSQRAKLHGRSAKDARKYAKVYAKILESKQDTVYAQIYIDALLTGRNESWSQNYAQAIADGNSKIYAQTYADILKNRKVSTAYAKNYAQAFTAGHDRDYADTYAQALSNGKNVYEARKAAIKKIEEEKASKREQARIDRETKQAEIARDIKELTTAHNDYVKALSERTKIRAYLTALMYRYQISMGMRHEYAIVYAEFYAKHRLNGVELLCFR